jgi:hypothetical protein
MIHTLPLENPFMKLTQLFVKMMCILANTREEFTTERIFFQDCLL